MAAQFPAALLLLALTALLVSVGLQDIRHREIANWKNAAIALAAPLWWLASGVAPWPDMAIQLGIALGVFALFLVPYCLGQMGGGDLKLLGALALWLPIVPLQQMLIVMSLIGGLVTAAFLLARRRGGKTIEIPYGVPIVLAMLGQVGGLNERIFNHFA